MTVQDNNKAVVSQFFAASSAGDIPAMLALWAPDAVNHGRFGKPGQLQQMPPAGYDGLRRVFESLHTAFSDRQWQVEDLIAEGDQVVCRLNVSGTHTGVPQIPVEGGALLNTVPPTGKEYAVQHIHIFRLVDGKIVEHWAARDDLGMLQQLGIVPEPALRR